MTSIRRLMMAGQHATLTATPLQQTNWHKICAVPHQYLHRKYLSQLCKRICSVEAGHRDAISCAAQLGSCHRLAKHQRETATQFQLREAARCDPQLLIRKPFAILRALFCGPAKMESAPRLILLPLPVIIAVQTRQGMR